MGNSPYCNHNSCIISSLRGLRNGLYYGAKIRFIHSFVMTFLFKEGSLYNKINHILSLTYEHSKTLGLYVFLYKSICCLFRKIFKSDFDLIPFIAGIIASYFMWRRKTPVTTQIMLYLLSRNLLTINTFFSHIFNKIFDRYPIIKYIFNYKSNINDSNSDNTGFAITSVLVWGFVMYFFERYPNRVHSSLYSSMDYLYNNSNITNSWKDYIPLYMPEFLFGKTIDINKNNDIVLQPGSLN